MTNYKELIDRDGGFTLDILGYRPLKGYVVSLPGYTRKIEVNSFSDEDIKDYAANYFYELTSGQNFYIGAWLENGEVWLDLSENVKDLTTALRLGKERNQIAIWDVVNGCELKCGGTGYDGDMKDLTYQARERFNGQSIQDLREWAARRVPTGEQRLPSDVARPAISRTT
jgi:hypothetical protein